MLDAATDCILLLDQHGRVVYANRMSRSVLGVEVDSPPSTGPQAFADTFPAAQRRKVDRAVTLATSGQAVSVRATSGSGSRLRRWDISLSPTPGNGDQVDGVLCIGREVTEQDYAIERLRAASESDALTGVPNGKTFRTRIARLIAQAEREGVKVGLLVLDLDNFKAINDTLGHAAGDQLLRSTVRSITAVTGSDALIGRLGGDEIAVALIGATNSDELIEIGRAITAAVRRPGKHGGQVLTTTATVGCALYPDDAADASTLMSFADAALNHQKATARGEVRAFDGAMVTALAEHVEQLERAWSIVRDGLLEMHYQPLVRLADGRLIGLEALLRWRTPSGELCGPDRIADAFQNYRLACDLGTAVRAQVLDDMDRWRDAGLPLVPVSINVAPAELLHEDFGEDFLAELAMRGFDPRTIEIEVTEEAVVDRGADLVEATLRVLTDAGVRVALDDFGTGHSGLMRLVNYPVGTIKIDRSFVARLATSSQGRAIVDAIIALARAVGSRVVAEGVETVEQLEYLLAADCDVVQGYLISPPIDRAAVDQWLSDSAQPTRRPYEAWASLS